MVRMELVNYFDVWGNKKDGFEVNNLCTECEIELPEGFTYKDILKELKKVGFIKKHVRLNMIHFLEYGLGDMIEFEEKRTGMPIGRIQEIYA